MSKSRKTYPDEYFLIQFKYWIVFGFILFIGVKPLVSFASVLNETKFELSEKNQIGDIEDREIELVSDDESEIPSCSVFPFSVVFIKDSFSFFETQVTFTKIDIDIHVPPPKL